MENLPPYWTNPYRTDFTVDILDKRQTSEGEVEIVIKDPVVRPAGGGQAGDKGFLNPETEHIRFTDTRKHGESTVLLADKAPSGDEKQSVAIDWKWRYSMMKNHTAEHLFVSQLMRIYPNMSVSELWIDGQGGNLTLQGAGIQLEDLLSAEDTVQSLIEQNISLSTDLVKSETVDAEVRAREGALGKHDEVRIVRIGEFDQSACSGIHVNETGEIGVFKIVHYNISDKSTQVSFLTGFRAINKLTNTYNAALQRTHLIPFEMEQLGYILDKYRNLQVSYDRMLDKIKSAVPNLIETKISGDIKILHGCFPGFDTRALRNAILDLTPSEPAFIVLFSPGDTSYVVARSIGLDQEAKFYIQDIVESMGGRGGGGGEIYTGGFSSIEEPDTTYDDLVSRVRNALE